MSSFKEIAMQKLKSETYRIAKRLGLRSEFLVLLFKIRRLFRLQSDEEKKLFDFYKELISNKSFLIFDIGIITVL